MNSVLEGTTARYGAASKYRFDDPSKWETVPNVPVLDEHEMTDEGGKAVAYVGRRELEQIAANNNKRVYATGDPAPLILGHTSDDPRSPEKPVVGYAVNYRVQPYRRNPDGTTRYAIFSDYKIRPKYAGAAEDYPRRSVELWWNKRELDPIALLGGTTPERDLGVVIRNARLKGVSLLGGSTPERDLGVTIRYDRRSAGTVLRYAMEDSMAGKNCAPRVSSHKYAEGEPFPGDDDLGDEGDDLDPGPGDDLSAGSDAGDAGGGEDDPMVAKILASKPIADLISKVDELYSLIAGEEGGAGGPPPGGDGMAPPAPGGAPPVGVDPEMREGHGDQPVRFEDDPAMYSAFGGPTNGTIPQFGGGGTRGTQYGRHTNGTPAMHTSQTARGQAAPVSQEVVKLQRQVRSMALQLSRANARDAINALKAEGYQFDNENREVEALAAMPDNERKFYVEEVIRKNYRRDDTPTVPQFGGVAQYARSAGPVGASADANDPNAEFEPTSTVEAVQYADAIQKHGGDRIQASKYMRSRKR
jgi:biotin operon repressor